MKSDSGEEAFQIHCCKPCNDCSNFQKIVDLKDAGLVIYRHSTRTEDINKNDSLLDTTANTAQDVFILHNTTNVEIQSADFVPELDQSNISCPRCKNIIKHAQKLLQKVPAIDKKDIMGVCDHCRTRDRSRRSCYECERIVKKFLDSKIKRREETEESVKTWLSKIGRLLTGVTDNVGKLKNVNIRALSEDYIDKLCQDIPRSLHEPEVMQMFNQTDYTDIPELAKQTTNKIFDTDIRNAQLEKLKRSVMFMNTTKPQLKTPVKSTDKEFLERDQEFMNLSSVDRAVFETNETQRQKTQNKQHNLPPDVTNLQEKEKTINSGKESIIPVYGKPQTDTIRAFFESGIKPRKIKMVEDAPIQITSIEDTQLNKYLEKTSQQTNEIEQKLKSLLRRQDKAYQSSISERKGKAIKDSSKIFQPSSRIRKYHSHEALVTSISGITEDFTYFFPKIVKETVESKRRVSSSELIKNTQEMLLARAEKVKIRLEEENKRKREEEEKRRILREKKHKIDEDKKKLVENAKCTEEKKRPKEIKKDASQLNKKEQSDEKGISKKVKTTLSVSSKSKPKDSRAASEKEREPKSEPKDSKRDKEKAVKAKKEQEKARKEQEKKEKLRREKEENHKLKEEKLKREKEEKEKLRRDKEEKLRREKEAKEENLRREKEEKEKQKAEKERYKREKEEQLRSEKEMEQKEKAASVQKPDVTGNKKEEVKVKKDQEEFEKVIINTNNTEESKKEINEVPTKSEKPKPEKKGEETTTKELNINQIKIRKPSPYEDDLILQLVKLRQSNPIQERVKAQRLSEINISPVIVKEHKTEHKHQKAETCLMCNDSDIELDVESIEFKKDKPEEIADIIVGQEILKYKYSLVKKEEITGVVPILFQSTFVNEESVPVKNKQVVEAFPEDAGIKSLPPILSSKSTKLTDQEVPKGIIRYTLSDRTFIDKGWTMLPTEKVVRKMNVYRMRPAHPEFDWFEHNKNKRLMQYDTGEKLAEFDDNGRGRWYYRNGHLALDYYDAEETNANQRFVVYSSGEPDERGRSHPITILATFDYLGNGIVFDHGGKIRLKYNQTEGVVLDRGIGPVSHWKWHTLNDPPVLQQVMIDTQMGHKDPAILKLGGPSDVKTRPDNEEMLAIEFDNFIKEKSKKLSQSFKPFQIKMKALKINEHFSLKVLDQATVYLIFRDGSTNLKLNIGMILDHKEIVDTDTAEVGDISNNLERFPARTDSLAGLQRSIAYAQRFERSRTERERRLRPSQPCASADKLTHAASKPLRPQLRTMPSGSTKASGDYCKCDRKPSSSNLYYDTRLF